MVTLAVPERGRQSLVSHSRIGWLVLGLSIVSMVLTIIGGRSTPTEDVDGYGIITALPDLYWGGIVVGLLATAFALHLAIVERQRYAALVPAIWLAAFHIGPHLAHAHVRFPSVWVHLGFVDLIERERAGDVLVDARFAWPGFYGAFVAPLAQLDDAVLETIMRLWPAAIIAATGILVSLLATRSYPTVPLIGPLAAVVYVMLSWTGQDHFSPQSFGYTAYLTMLVLLESGPMRTSSAWSASVPVLSRFAAAGGERPVSRTTPVFVALIVLSFGAIVSHPLAPFFICTGLVILGLYGRTVAWRLVLLVAVTYLLWFVVAAEPWYSTQLDSLVDELGDLFVDVGVSTGQVANASSERLVVTRVRSLVGVATFLAVPVIGLAMATERFRHLRPAIPLTPLAAIPSLALALQSYGGEVTFGILLFTLPMAAILIARVLATLRIQILPIVAPLLIVAMTPLLLVARFGDEAFEMTTAVDREVVQAAYDRAPEDALIVVDSGFVALQDQTIASNDVAEIEHRPDQTFIKDMRDAAELSGRSRIIVVITPSAQQWSTQGRDAPEGFLDDVARFVSEQPGAEVVFERDGGWVIEL